MKVLKLGAIAAAFLIAASSQAFSAPIDILVNKLVEKRILSETDAREVLYEISREIDVQETAKKDKGFARGNIKFSGDMRLRNEYSKKEGSAARNRQRVRFRLGTEMPISDKVTVAARLVTGSEGVGSARSTNQTLTDTFSTKGFHIDKAYVKYKPFDWATFYGGKFSDPVHRNVSYLWDSDITPEGGALKIHYKPEEDWHLYLNAGVFILDELSASTDDPFMYVAQPGIGWQFHQNAWIRVNGTYYGFTHVEGAALDGTASTNTLAGAGLAHDYDAFAVNGELVIHPEDHFPRLAAYGEYLNNPDPDDDNEAYMIGGKIGSKKVKKKGQWHAFYNYRRIERDAFLDTFPDADILDGDTHIEAHQTGARYGLIDNVDVGFTYMYSEPLSGADIDENKLQVDSIYYF